MHRFLLVTILLLGAKDVYCGTLDDIRTKTGWHPPYKSEYIQLVTPSELLSYLDKYHRDTIKMQVMFYGITNESLNTWIGPKNNRHRWSSARYVSFRIKDPQKLVSARDINLFISKTNPDSEKLPNLIQNAPILVTGMVRDTVKGKAWIEVLKIEL